MGAAPRLTVRCVQLEALPVEGEEFGEFGEVAGVGGDYGDAEAASAGGVEGVIGEGVLADLLVVVPGGEPGKGLASPCPVAEIGDDDAPGFRKVAFEAFNDATAARVGSGVQFFENDGAEPKRPALCDSAQTEGCSVRRTHRGNIKGSIE